MPDDLGLLDPAPAVHVQGRNGPAVADDRRGVGDGPDLIELVRDHNARDALGPEPAKTASV